MEALLAAVRDLLPPRYPVHEVAVQGEVSYPYVLLWPTPGTPDSVDVADTLTELDTDLGVTVVADTPLGLYRAHQAVREALLDQVPVVAGRTFWPLRISASQAMQPDRDVTITGTDTHPLFAVDIWTCESTTA